MAESASDRSEKATPRRREEAREKGQVVLSPEVSPVAVLLAALAMASFGGPRLLAQSRLVLRGWLASIGPAAAADDAVGPMIAHAVLQMVSVLAPFFIATAVVGAGAIVAQIGFAVRPQLLVPDPGRMNPARGMKRIFSAAGAVGLMKAVLKIAIVGAIAYRVLWRAGNDAVAAPGMTLDELLAFTGYGMRRLLIGMAMALGVLGVADYLW